MDGTSPFVESFGLALDDLGLEFPGLEELALDELRETAGFLPFDTEEESDNFLALDSECSFAGDLVNDDVLASDTR